MALSTPSGDALSASQRPCLTHFPSLLTESNFVAGDDW